MVLGEFVLCKFDVDISFAATSDAMKQDRIGGAGFDVCYGAFLSGVKWIAAL